MRKCSVPIWEATISPCDGSSSSAYSFRAGLDTFLQRWWSSIINYFVYEAHVRIQYEVIKTKHVILVQYGTVVVLNLSFV